MLEILRWYRCIRVTGQWLTMFESSIRRGKMKNDNCVAGKQVVVEIKIIQSVPVLVPRNQKTIPDYRRVD